MVARKKTKRRRKKPVKKQWLFPSIGKLVIFFILFFVLIASLCTAGYVIFFRTVFAQEIMPVLKNSIVFEEPDPPVPQTPPQMALPVKKSIAIDEKPITIKKNILPKVAIIFDDIGYQYEIGRRLLEMPFNFTFSFLPFAPYTKQLEEVAYNLGKTVFLHLPLQPQSTQFDPGPGALMVEDVPEIQKEKFAHCLDAVPHAVGVNNHMGSLYTENIIAMDILMDEIRKRSLIFIDSYTTASSVGLERARRHGIKSARRHVFLDNNLNEEHICKQLEKLVKIAEERGVGIGIAHPHEETLNAFNICGPLYESKIQYTSILEVI